eukprot:4408538-Pleurochrysis_carterae.AAC.1
MHMRVITHTHVRTQARMRAHLQSHGHMTKLARKELANGTQRAVVQVYNGNIVWDSPNGAGRQHDVSHLADVAGDGPRIRSACVFDEGLMHLPVSAAHEIYTKGSPC